MLGSKRSPRSALPRADGTLNIAVSSHLPRRAREHRCGLLAELTKRCRTRRRGPFERVEAMAAAIACAMPMNHCRHAAKPPSSTPEIRTGVACWRTSRRCFTRRAASARRGDRLPAHHHRPGSVHPGQADSVLGHQGTRLRPCHGGRASCCAAHGRLCADTDTTAVSARQAGGSHRPGGTAPCVVSENSTIPVGIGREPTLQGCRVTNGCNTGVQHVDHVTHSP